MKIIKINTDHYIQVDDSEIKEGDYYLCWETINDIPSNYEISDKPLHSYCIGADNYKKITHSTQPLEQGYILGSEQTYKFENIKYLDLSEAKELLGEVDVEKKAEEISIKRIPTDIFPDCNVERRWIFEGIVEGYNQALEDNKDKKFTEEIFDTAIQVVGSDKVTTIRDFLLEHIQPKTEWEVEYDENGKLKLV